MVTLVDQKNFMFVGEPPGNGKPIVTRSVKPMENDQGRAGSEPAIMQYHFPMEIEIPGLVALK